MEDVKIIYVRGDDGYFYPLSLEEFKKILKGIKI